MACGMRSRSCEEESPEKGSGQVVSALKSCEQSCSPESGAADPDLGPSPVPLSQIKLVAADDETICSVSCSTYVIITRQVLSHSM